MTFRPAPKPPKIEKAKPTRVRRKNVKRSTEAFKRAYHSRERVLWIKSQPCVVCGALHWAFKLALARSENAHTEIGGAGLKGHYSTIVPMCPTHHKRYDERVAPLDEPYIRAALKKCAANIELLWQSFGGDDHAD